MTFRPQQSIAMITALTLFSMTTVSQPAVAGETHLVDLSELHRDLQTSAAKRTKDMADIERVFSLPAAQQALAKSHLNTEQVTKAIATLDDKELANLANKARAAEQDVQGGIIIGILALIGLVVVILIVIAVVD